MKDRSQQIEATNERKWQWLLFQWVERLWWRNEAWTRKEQQGWRHLMRRWERRGGKEWGRSGEGNRESKREREMMGIIRIKMVGFGQSRVRATVSTPISYPPPVPSSGLNQLNWHMQGASMTHKQTTHGCRGNVPKAPDQLSRNTWLYAPDLTSQTSDQIFTFELIWWC